MNKVSQADRMRLTRYREATEWVLRLNVPNAADEELDGWLRWYEADGENLAAFEKLQRDWQDTEGFKQAPELLAASGRANTVRAVWSPSTVAGLRPWSDTPFLRWGLAAGLALIAALGIWQWTQRAEHQVVATLNQEPTTLPDGSSLLLSAKATADVDFSGIERHVALRAGGEAYIKVRRDKARPFTVRAGAMTVTAVGTAFDVRREGSQVTVIVEEGTVLASAPSPGGPTQWRVGAGYQVRYSENVGRAVVSRVDTQSVLRWRDGELAYEDAPLEMVIHDINRYSTMNVVAQDPALLQLHYTGTVFVAAVADWVSALEVQYPVHSRVSAEGQIVLEARASSSPRAR